MSQATEYKNWWSKLLFAKKFERQFIIPLPHPPIERLLFKAIERWKFNTDLSTLKINKPVFIIGLPRSGTTVLYNLLCAHSQAAYITNSMNAYPEALCTIEWLRKKLDLDVRGERFLADSIVTDFGSPSEPLTFWGKWMGRDADSLYWPEMRLRDLAPEKVKEIHSDIRKIISCFGPESELPSKRFICKYPVIQTELRMVQDLFPDAHFIHIVRDSRQAANSLLKLYHLINNQIAKIKHPTVQHMTPYPRVSTLPGYVEKFGADNIQTTAHIWQDSIELVHQTAPDLKHYYEVKYEDILQNPEPELKKIFAFCELSWPAPGNSKFTEEFSRLGKTSHKNSYSDFELIEKITEPTLKKLGYLQS